LYIYLTPCIPISFKDERELVCEKGFVSLKFSFIFYILLTGKGGIVERDYTPLASFEI